VHAVYIAEHAAHLAPSRGEGGVFASVGGTLGGAASEEACCEVSDTNDTDDKYNTTGL